MKAYHYHALVVVFCSSLRRKTRCSNGRLDYRCSIYALAISFLILLDVQYKYSLAIFALNLLASCGW